MSLSLRRWVFLVVVVAAVIAIDQISKAAVIRNLELFESAQPIPALVPYFQFTRSFNTGSAFGFLSNFAFAGTMFLVIAVVVSAVLAWSYGRLGDGQPLARLATALVIGGALGNALDRVQHGHVIDFIHYQLPGVISNVSNLADHAIVLGVGMMIWSSFRTAPDQQDTTEAEPADANS